MTKGRQSKYTKAIAHKICMALSEGKSLRAICRDPKMPSEKTVRTWALDDYKGFAAPYARARDIGLDCMADELLYIADTPAFGVKTKEYDDGRIETTTEDMTNHRRLQIQARQWILCKLAPKKYGDKLDVDMKTVNVTISKEDKDL